MRKSEYKKKLGVAEGIDHWYDYNSIKDTLTLEKCKDQLHSEIGARLVVEDMVRDLLKQLADKPEAKFKVGDRVRWGKDLGTVTEPEREPDYITINWDDGNYGTVIFSDLELIAPPVTTCGCPGGYAKVAEVPTSARPERKFKIGNQVTHRDSKKVRKIKNYYFSSEDNEWKYDIGFYYVESELTLHIAPTPAELIPTLVDRVRDMKHACIQAVQYVLDDYEEYEVTTKEIKFAILEMLRNTQVTYDEPETEVKR